jgi:glutaredoxin 3
MTKVEIYTTAYCPYCVRAKALLTEKGIDFKEIKIDGNPTLRSEMIQRSNGAYTVPQIFIAEKHIGGCDDLYALEATNALDSLLAQ